MTYKTHINFSIFLLLLFIINFHLTSNMILNTFIVAFASVLADIDNQRSFISNRKMLTIIIFLFLFIIFEIYIYKLILVIIWMILSRKFGHRKLSHSIFSIIFFFIIFYGHDIVFYFLIGYISHILLDIISGGVSLLYPLTNKVFGIRLVKTDSSIEKTIMYILVALNAYLIIDKILLIKFYL